MYQKGDRNLSNSHYWVRENMGTRYEFDNCDTLCKYPCHFQKWEKQKNDEYREYMLKKLGKKKFRELEIKAKGITKFSNMDLQLLVNQFQNIWKEQKEG